MPSFSRRAWLLCCAVCMLSACAEGSGKDGESSQQQRQPPLECWQLGGTAAQVDSSSKQLFLLHAGEHVQLHAYLCSVESLARQAAVGSHYVVRLMTPNPASLLSALPSLEGTAAQQRLTVCSLDWAEVFAHTPFQPFYESNGWEQSKRARYYVAHLSDAFRLAMLFKHGGMYLDLDMIAVSGELFQNDCQLAAQGKIPFDPAHPDHTHFLNQFMQFEQHDPLLLLMMADYMQNYNGSNYLAQYNAVDRTMRACHSQGSQACANVRLAPASKVDPFGWQEHVEVLRLKGRAADVLLQHMQSNCWVLHWFSATRFAKQDLPEWRGGTLLEKLMQQACPSVMETMSDQVFANPIG